MKKHYYAKDSLRGFANEVAYLQFATRAERDGYCASNETCSPCTRDQVRSQLARKDDATTEYHYTLWAMRYSDPDCMIVRSHPISIR